MTRHRLILLSTTIILALSLIAAAADHIAKAVGGFGE